MRLRIIHPSKIQRKNWWRWFCVIWLGISLLLIGGCQPSNHAANVPIQLTLWHGINPPPNRDVFNELVDRFNQTHSDIQVEALYVGQSDRQLPKVLTAVVGNAPPDILWFGPMLTGQLVELGAIRPIEDWLDRSPVKSEIDPVMFESMKLNDHIWSVPMAVNNVGIFYRPSLFKAAGISQVPKTWAEFRQVAKQLTRDESGDGRSDRYGMLLPLGKGEWTVFTWLPFMFSAGGELVDNGKPNLVNEGAIAALQLWSDLLSDGSAINSQPERGYENDLFLSGKVAMQLTGPWTLGYLSETGVDFDVFAIPAKEQSASVMGGENLFVMNTGNPEREQAALQFLEYAVSEAFQIQWSLGTGYLPINLKARESETYREFVAKQPLLNVFLEQMNAVRSRPLIPGYPRISESLGRAIESVLLGAPPKKALQFSQDRLELSLNITE